jgi:hypothetical protein
LKIQTEIREMPGSVGSNVQKVKFITVLHEPSDGTWLEFVQKVLETKPKVARIEGVDGGFVFIEKVGAK